MTEHSFYMERAIQLAKRGTGFTNPNPLVGAVIVKDHRIIGEGWHARYGDLHAERNALKHCTEDPAGATMYVTLEPCCHHGKQPPCTEALVKSGIRRVYIGSRDPNPLVSGKGVQYLEEHGIEVIPDFLREACDKLNPIFFRYIGTKMPYTILKYAMTADGKIACAGGASKWVTGEAARAHVQQTRKRVAAVCVGIGTVLADDPCSPAAVRILLSRCEWYWIPACESPWRAGWCRLPRKCRSLSLLCSGQGQKGGSGSGRRYRTGGEAAAQGGTGRVIYAARRISTLQGGTERQTHLPAKLSGTAGTAWAGQCADRGRCDHSRRSIAGKLL